MWQKTSAVMTGLSSGDEDVADDTFLIFFPYLQNKEAKKARMSTFLFSRRNEKD